ncbi:MAG: hypothetical protein M0D57_18955 [Sphingobacteriales bacterium JAD_PAG50586_3]|nr:MAG: hypothetical protein M0D57_18955 [Sphingobacteriales bacterium JAD_PAG50586_3]
MKYLLLFSLIILMACSSKTEKEALPIQAKLPPINIPKSDTTTIVSRLFKDLSYIYNYQLTYTTKIKRKQPYYSHRNVEVFDKKTGNRVDSLGLEVPDIMSFAENIDDARSYITGKDKNKGMVDNYAGDFVVADLNFDGREDFAIPTHSGASVGPYSTFFVQGNDGKFTKDAFLTDSVEFFPNKIYPEKRMLLTLVHATAYSVGEHKYVLNNKGQWHQISHRFLGE